MRRLLAITAVAGLVLVAGGAAADTFGLTVVSETSNSITFSYPQQSGYGYLYSANGAVVSRTYDPSRTQIRFSKADSYEVAALVKGTTGSYPVVTPPPPPKPACSDGIDNDGDNKTDYPADPGCSSATDNDEFNAPPPPTAQCADGQDNDGDGLVDLSDPGCTGPTDDDETNTLPPPTGFPDASNTGPSGTLTTYTGPSNISTAGTVIDSKNMGCVQVSAKNVTIKNSVIRCPGSDYYSVDVGSSGSVTVQDSIIDCQNHNSNGAGRMYITLVRVEIVNCENGLSVAHDVTVRDSFIHDLYSGGGAHDDGMQFEGAAGFVNILHNTIYGVNAQGDQGTSSFIADLSGHHDWLVENNLFSGGAYTVYCVLGKGTNWIIRNNAFSLRYGRNGTSGLFGFSTQCGDETQSGNYVLETGQQIHLG